jgi:aminoglycoside N3'-acetyltransferase
MGPQSPLGLLYADDGYGLLLGVDYHSNTFHHVVETIRGVPCLGRRTEAYPARLADGRMVEARTVQGRTWGWRNGMCPLTDQNRYGSEMRARGLERVEMIGQCRATLFRLQDCFEVVAAMLEHGKDGFPPCSGCPIRPRVTARTVPSDWDETRQMLLPDSVGWMY